MGKSIGGRQTISVTLSEEVLAVQRKAIEKDGYVYFLTVNRIQKYLRGNSRIVYIGSTKGGFGRIFASAADKIYDEYESLDDDFESLSAFMLTHLGEAYPLELEHAVLKAFQELYGEYPKHNRISGRTPAKGRRELFQRADIEHAIRQFEK